LTGAYNVAPAVRSGEQITATATTIRTINGRTEQNSSEFGRAIRPSGDVLAPTVAFTSLRGEARIFPAPHGVANDRSGSEGGAYIGIKRVSLFIQRQRDSRYWNGSSWVAGPVFLPTELGPGVATHANTWRYNGRLPQDAGLEEGSYTLRAQAEDNAGRIGNAAQALLIDRQPPIVTFTTPTNGQSVNLLTEVRGTLSDNIRPLSLRLFIQRLSDGKYFNGREFVTEPHAFHPGVFGSVWRLVLSDPSLAPLPDGAYRLTAIAEDAALNRTVTAINVTQRQSATPGI
jgi:hypothetical protein